MIPGRTGAGRRSDGRAAAVVPATGPGRCHPHRGARPRHGADRRPRRQDQAAPGRLDGRARAAPLRAGRPREPGDDPRRARAVAPAARARHAGGGAAARVGDLAAGGGRCPARPQPRTAVDDLQKLFPTRTAVRGASTVFGSLFTLVSGYAWPTALQRGYEIAWGVASKGWRGLWRPLVWLTAFVAAGAVLLVLPRSFLVDPWRTIVLLAIWTPVIFVGAGGRSTSCSGGPSAGGSCCRARSP